MSITWTKGKQFFSCLTLTALVGGFLLVIGIIPASAVSETGLGPVQYMHVVAHPDDDLFFMNPDIYQAIQAGAPTVTVYVTASEISGNGSTPAQKARSLQRGVEDAYARMAGVPDVNPAAQEEWTGVSWTIGTRKVERYTLTARPEIQLVFVNLRDARLASVYDSGFTDTTIIPTGGTVTQAYSYNKANVISVLGAIIDSYHPSVLRFQDTQPDGRYTGDHADHFAAARFTKDAVATYTGQVSQVNYRDYNINDSPSNLTSAAFGLKEHFFEVYAPYDDMATPSNWLDRMYYRWPRGTQWVGRTAAGRPQPFMVRTGVVTTWAQAADGSWPAPQALPNSGGPVLPSLSVITNVQGTLQVFARRQNDHRIITLAQNTNGTWPASWTDLGNPNSTFGGDASQVGVPVVAANANGSLWVFIKDGGGGVCARKQNAAGTSWGAWQDLGGGADVQPDGLAAIRGSDGRVELFAATTTNVLKWRQSSTNGNMAETGALPMLAGVQPASPPSVTKNHDGTLEVLYREGGTTNMITTFQTAVGGSWNPTPVRLGGHGGIGQPAVVTAPAGADARIMIFERNDATGVSMTKQQAPDSAYESWVDMGGTIVDYPAAVTDSTGAVNLFAIGSDGRFYTRKQATPGANSAFTPWQPI